MYTLDASGKRIYTLKKVAAGDEVTKSAHPARFSPDDKYSRYVRRFSCFALVVVALLWNKLRWRILSILRGKGGAEWLVKIGGTGDGVGDYRFFGWGHGAG